MLSRTADHLFWTARYMERADFLARILDSALRLSSMPAMYGGENTWESVIAMPLVCLAFVPRLKPMSTNAPRAQGSSKS